VNKDVGYIILFYRQGSAQFTDYVLLGRDFSRLFVIAIIMSILRWNSVRSCIVGTVCWSREHRALQIIACMRLCQSHVVLMHPSVCSYRLPSGSHSTQGDYAISAGRYFISACNVVSPYDQWPSVTRCSSSPLVTESSTYRAG